MKHHKDEALSSYANDKIISFFPNFELYIC